MKAIRASDAFGLAPPRTPCVLCLQSRQGGTDMILTEWFTWLNIKRNPMLSFSLPRGCAVGADLREGDSFVLAFPPAEIALRYKQSVHVESAQAPDGLPVPPVRESVIALSCTLANAYNYPFKKVRIFNCNLEEAFGDPEQL